MFFVRRSPGVLLRPTAVAGDAFGTGGEREGFDGGVRWLRDSIWKSAIARCGKSGVRTRVVRRGGRAARVHCVGGVIFSQKSIRNLFMQADGRVVTAVASAPEDVFLSRKPFLQLLAQPPECLILAPLKADRFCNIVVERRGSGLL